MSRSAVSHHALSVLDDMVASCERIVQLPVLGLSAPCVVVHEASARDVEYIHRHYAGLGRTVSTHDGRRMSFGAFLSSNFPESPSTDANSNSHRNLTPASMIARIEESLSVLESLVSSHDLPDEQSEYLALKSKFLRLQEALQGAESTLARYTTDSERSGMVHQRQHVSLRPMADQLEQARLQTSAMMDQKSALQSEQSETQGLADTMQSEITNLVAEEEAAMKEGTQEVDGTIETLHTQLVAAEERLRDLEMVLKSILIASPGVYTPSKSSVRMQQEHEELLAEVDRLRAEIRRREDTLDSLSRTHPEVLALQRQLEAARSQTAVLERSHQMYRSMANYLVARLASEDNAFAIALQILAANGNHMYLKDLKSELGSMIDPAQVLQTIYALVAHSLIQIDRSSSEATVMGSL
jgi:predicted metal-dependent hydrolase